jgi:Gas vesicle synthesis protein GvpL/GvpF
MAAPSQSRRASRAPHETGIYVYGIFPGDIELVGERTGVGDPPAKLRVVRSGDLAAVVSEVDLARALGSPDDLMTHESILDSSAADMPVLPMRFGAVLASEDAVASELLDEHHDEFAAALGELDGRAEYVVKGRYVEQAVLEAVLSENPQAARLREKIRGVDADATRDARIQLGEIIGQAITSKRAEDTRVLGDRMAGHCVASLVREPTHEWDAVHVAFLVDTGQEEELVQAIEGLAGTWAGRVELRLIGPIAAYDFVGGTGTRGVT